MRPFNALATEVVRCVKGDAANKNMKITGMISRFPRCGASALRTPNGNRRHIAAVRMRALLGKEECQIMRQTAENAIHPLNLLTLQ